MIFEITKTFRTIMGLMTGIEPVTDLYQRPMFPLSPHQQVALALESIRLQTNKKTVPPVCGTVLVLDFVCYEI
jgi:hypothetical protein